jgi:hypothetical protein
MRKSWLHLGKPVTRLLLRLRKTTKGEKAITDGREEGANGV